MATRGPSAAFRRALGCANERSAFAIIENAGHNPMWERPKAFNLVVTDFLRTGRITPTTSASPAIGGVAVVPVTRNWRPSA